MKNKLVLSALLASLAIGTAFADCTFTYVNTSSHPVTLQGYFLEAGDAKTDEGWVTVAPTRQLTQVRQAKKCNSIYQHSGQIATRIDLKNNSAYWIGNKGFLFAADRSYPHGTATSDDGQPVTLSDGIKVSGKEFKVVICSSNISSANCSK